MATLILVLNPLFFNYSNPQLNLSFSFGSIHSKPFIHPWITTNSKQMSFIFISKLFRLVNQIKDASWLFTKWHPFKVLMWAAKAQKLSKGRKKTKDSCCGDWCRRNDRGILCHAGSKQWRVEWNCLQTWRLPKQDQDPRHRSRIPDTSKPLLQHRYCWPIRYIISAKTLILWPNMIYHTSWDAHIVGQCELI